MKRIFTYLAVPAVIIGLAFAYMPFLATNSTAATTNLQLGGAIYQWNAGDFSSEPFRAAVRQIQATHANYVTLVIPYYQDNTTASTIYPGDDTPTDADLTNAINYAHSLGLKVMLKPHITNKAGGWRAYINASNRTSWYASYGAMLNHLGDIAKQNNVEEICIGTELITMTASTSNPDNTTQWNKMIQSLRSRYPGLLTYSANWGGEGFNEEVAHIGFWQNLDSIGISGYYTLSGGTVQDFVNSWTNWNKNKILPLYNQYHKPIIFTELGYRSVDGAHSDPFDGQRGGNVNLQEQVNLYEAFFKFWSTQPHFGGIQIWNFDPDPNAGGVNQNHYTPQNKPAYNTITKWFTDLTDGSTPPPPPPPPTGTWSATASGTVNPVGSATTFAARINPGTTLNGLVDFEIYSTSGTRVYQQVMDNQSFQTNQAVTLNPSWTPTTAGTYVLKVGVFSNDWSTNYYWNNSALTFNVGQTPPPPPPPPTTGTRVTSLTLYNANTDKAIGTFSSGAIINTTQTPNVSVLANTTGTPIGSVEFKVDGTRVHIENGAPYSINGNTGTDYLPWKLPAKGNHTLTVTLYTQQKAAGSVIGQPYVVNFTVTSGTTPPPPTNNDVTIISPVNNTVVNGVRTLKATISGKNLADYTMYWNVDGGGLNQMYNATDGSQAKQYDINFTGWNWKGTGPYTINVIAKDTAGNTLSQKSVSVTVQ